MKPLEQKLGEMAPEVVKDRGVVYSGVHNFSSEFLWSPDSRNIGLVDCLVDYRLRDDSQEAFEEGRKPENRRCFGVIVALDGAFRRIKIPANSQGKFGLRWNGTRTLLVSSGNKSVEIRAPKPQPNVP